MKSKWNGIYLVMATVVVSLAASAHAQFIRTDGGPLTQEFNYRVAGDGQSTFFFESNMESPLVKGSPYTAKAITTTTQTLSDGNKITHTNEVQLARDSEGRTRREQNLAELGPWKTNNTGSVITINDPVAHTRYELHREGDKTFGSKTTSLERTRVLEAKAKMMADAQAHEGHGSGVGVGVGVGDEPGVGRNIVIVTSGNESDVVRYKTEADANQNKNVKVEDLGTQTVEGVSAKGTRKTITIPAGQIGNEQPINIVSETWFSPDLQLTVMSKRNDPRVGETEFRMTNIQRVEPDASLFQPPPGVEIMSPRTREREF